MLQGLSLPSFELLSFQPHISRKEERNNADTRDALQPVSIKLMNGKPENLQPVVTIACELQPFQVTQHG